MGKPIICKFFYLQIIRFRDLKVRGEPPGLSAENLLPSPKAPGRNSVKADQDEPI